MIKKNLILLLFLAILFPVSINAQYIELKEEVETHNHYDMNTGMSNVQTFTKIKFRKEGESSYKGIGVAGRRLREYIITDSEALNELNKHRRLSIISISSATASVASLSIFGITNVMDVSVSSPGGDTWEAKGYLYSGIGFLAVTLITKFISKRKVYNAIQIYNGNIYKRKNQDSGSIFIEMDVFEYQDVMSDSNKMSLGVKVSF